MKTGALTLWLLVLLLPASPARGQRVTRERNSFNADWRFQKDDPPGTEGQLAYERVKPWVIATGNEFINGERKPVRPDGDPGKDIAYVQTGFNDRDWRALNLPHDWGIEGPFKQEYPGETGKLPWWGVGWYRKHFKLEPSDAGKQISLEIDGAMSYANVWLNGHYVGGWPYGYASWALDLTPYLKSDGGENVIA